MKRQHHVGLYVSDLKASTDFYVDVLGLKPTELVLRENSEVARAFGMDHQFLSCGSLHHDIALMQHFDDNGEVVPVDPHGLMHVAFELDDDQTVEGFAEGLREKGIEIFYGPVRHVQAPDGDGGSGGNYAVYFRDPDGHLIEVSRDMEPYPGEISRPK
jgi:catechol 2,3-dioxygenase-like lactoylglutathione lyase family enzyme